MKPVAADVGDFAALREGGFVYVDKTAFLRRLVTSPETRLCLVSRPGGFGKSLALSAVKAAFSGRRELFEGLAFSQSPWAWTSLPVIDLRLGGVAADGLDAFDAALSAAVADALAAAGAAPAAGAKPAEALDAALHGLSGRNGGRGAVVLVDDCDAPVWRALGDKDLAAAVRARLEGLFAAAARNDDVRFMMLAGRGLVAAPGGVADLSQNPDFATAFGCTEKDLSENFDEHLRLHADKMRRSYGMYRDDLCRWYGGFRFSPASVAEVFNPRAVALALSRRLPMFRSFWGTGACAAAGLCGLGREEVAGLDMENVPGVASAALASAAPNALGPAGMLFKAGFLTIRSANAGAGTCTLGVPDEDVRRDFAARLTAAAAGETPEWASALGKALLAAKWPEAFAGLDTLYANVAPGPSYAHVLCTLLASQGFRFRVEDEGPDGRADVVADHALGAYIFALRVGERVNDNKAFAHILKKGYDAPYRDHSRPIWSVSISFDPTSRRLVETGADRL